MGRLGNFVGGGVSLDERIRLLAWARYLGVYLDRAKVTAGTVTVMIKHHQEPLQV